VPQWRVAGQFYFFLLLKNLETLKITTFRRLDLSSSSGNMVGAGGDTYSVGSGRPSCSRSVDRGESGGKSM
jgi:hypothetical protein